MQSKEEEKEEKEEKQEEENEEKQEDKLKIERVEKEVDLVVLKAVQNEKKYVKGTTIRIDNNGLKHELSQRPYGTKDLLIGRANQTGKLSIAFDNGSKMVSRLAATIKFERRDFWVQDESTNGYPCFINLTPDFGINLKKGQIFLVGNILKKTQQYLEVTDVYQKYMTRSQWKRQGKGDGFISKVIKLKDLEPETNSFFQALNEFGEQYDRYGMDNVEGSYVWLANQEKKKQIDANAFLIITNLSTKKAYKFRHYLPKINKESNIPICTEGAPGAGKHRQALLLGFNGQESQLKNQDQRWGHLSYNIDNGWFITGTAESMDSPDRIRCILKDREQITKQTKGDFIMIMDKVQLEIGGSYLFQCNDVPKKRYNQQYGDDDDSDNSDSSGYI